METMEKIMKVIHLPYPRSGTNGTWLTRRLEAKEIKELKIETEKKWAAERKADAEKLEVMKAEIAKLMEDTAALRGVLLWLGPAVCLNLSIYFAERKSC